MPELIILASSVKIDPGHFYNERPGWLVVVFLGVFFFFRFSFFLLLLNNFMFDFIRIDITSALTKRFGAIRLCETRERWKLMICAYHAAAVFRRFARCLSTSCLDENMMNNHKTSKAIYKHLYSINVQDDSYIYMAYGCCMCSTLSIKMCIRTTCTRCALQNQTTNERRNKKTDSDAAQLENMVHTITPSHSPSMPMVNQYPCNEKS